MIDKEIFELLDAISREKGEAMSPFEELLLLGYYPEKRKRIKNDIDEEEDYDDFTREEENGEAEEEYDFDEDDEAYTLLSDILCRNNDRKKYFA